MKKNEKLIFIILVVVFTYLMFFVIAPYANKKANEDLRKYKYMDFKKEYRFKVKKIKFTKGWNQIITNNNDSILVSLSRPSDVAGRVYQLDSITKNKNSYVVSVYRDDKLITYKLAKKKDLNPEVVGENDRNK
ncbi:hypothetical protein [Aureibacter tunicatorum]|uniref:Lipopolysaccharide export LptBFGC system permease protein LptF n=1 Tax=Aureibacter tunicatorum TaxID=866807 RepID=A0AAE4BSL7_9BACT|nr:hypothetical protein [Aureibacter tunicatorum]MDR6241359.1 lipopolysaccharide export LptBFGC system permease protein LptF [Aureibacter tunicatorum]BDD06796.1 hypothetical protein AUTU_42790 [Aureibacter tunicatorum]